MGGGKFPLKRLGPKTIGIVGSRRRNHADDYTKMCEVFNAIYRSGDRIVSGGCPKGADRFAEILAKAGGYTITIHYPDWERNGRAAGFIRNTFIARDADILIALVADDRTGGAEDTIRKFKQARRDWHQDKLILI